MGHLFAFVILFSLNYADMQRIIVFFLPFKFPVVDQETLFSPLHAIGDKFSLASKSLVQLSRAQTQHNLLPVVKEKEQLLKNCVRRYIQYLIIRIGNLK